MKKFKVFNTETRDVGGKYNRVYDVYSSRISRTQRKDIIAPTYRKRFADVDCQCNIRKEIMCTCRRVLSPGPRYYSSPKQVYRYADWRSFTDIGVGSIKVLPRKKIRKIYLPETIDKAVGSTDLTILINSEGRNRQQWSGNYYENKRTSKCVGRFKDNDNISFVHKKLSPIIQKLSVTTSPKCRILRDQNNNIESCDLQKCKFSTSTQVNLHEYNTNPVMKPNTVNSNIKSILASKQTLKEVPKNALPTVADTLRPVVLNDNSETCKDYSSDSFVQHVHNLENPSNEKQSKTSVDIMENKIEREYRKIFTSKSKERPSVDKPISDFKSASLLRRRFEALKRGIIYKESKKSSTLINKISSQFSMPNHKDVSIASDPPSLEGRSYSNTKLYSPYQSPTNQYKLQVKTSIRNQPKVQKNKDSLAELYDDKYESVQGMFKLWGKKFNLDENNWKITAPTISNDKMRSPKEISKAEPPPQAEFPKKKQGRKFFSFRKKTKNKDKENKPYKPKKGVTAGRCELKDGLTIKVGGPNEYPVSDNNESCKKQDNHLEKCENILRKTWLDKYITNTRDSRNSVHIRWNNNMYTTSSSTILELIDTIYKHNGIWFRSRSEITTGESSNPRPNTKPRVHFMQQDIETWMVPKMITNNYQSQSIDHRVHHNHNKCQRLLVDASKKFSQKIKLVLRTIPNSKSCEYVIINIPEEYYSHSSCDLQAQSSDEKIYKIIEYDTSELKKIKETRNMATGDNLTFNTKISDSAQNNKKEKELSSSPGITQNTLLFRDVATQGSNVFLPKRCDVIGVGIITQRDMRDVKKPVIRINDELSEDESEENLSMSKKQCELAESYLQDYYRHWMPSGIGMFSWHANDSQHSDKNSVISLSQGDGTKSSLNIYENYQESTVILSSCETSSCSHCMALEDQKKPDDSLKCKWLSKFKKKSTETPLISDKRNCPKDSIEVYKRRQFYSCSNQKSKWYVDDNESYSLPSIEGKAKITDCPKLNKPCWRMPVETKKKNQKHVSLSGCGAMNNLVSDLPDRSTEGILSFKGSDYNRKDSDVPKHTKVSEKPSLEIRLPLRNEACTKEKKPPCSEKMALPCDELPQSEVNVKKLIPPYEVNIPPPWSPPLCSKPVKAPPCSACCNTPGKSSNEYLQQKNVINKNPYQLSDSSLQLSPRVSPKHSDTSFPSSPNNIKKMKCKPNCANTNKLISSKESRSDICVSTHPKNSKKKKECKPNCANMNKFNKLINTPQTQPPTTYDMPQTPDCINESRDKLTGLHLKKMPYKNTIYADDYIDSNELGAIRLSSTEQFKIRMKEDTPSTEEIRECVNIKVQDEDGQTLYERIDYKKSGDVNKCLLLDNVYKTPLIQRVSTPPIVQEVVGQNNSQKELCEEKSVDNLIVINLTLKLKQGDKGTEVNIKSGDTEIKQNEEEKTSIEAQKCVYTVQNQYEQEPVVNGNKNDVNIKIVIKSYNKDPEKTNEMEMYTARNAANELFNKGISQKFQTVSTGYSEDTDQHIFAIDKMTEDLTASAHTLDVQNKISMPAVCNQLINVPEKLTLSSQGLIECSATKQIVNSMKYSNLQEISAANVEKCYENNVSKPHIISHDDADRFKEDKSKSSVLEFKNDIGNKMSIDTLLHKNISLHNRIEKKEMLKKLFSSSSAVKKEENKKKVIEIIRAILTSDSSATDIAVTSNELAKELTYASLDPGYFRDADSIANFNKLDSEASNYEDNQQQKLNPTKNNSEVISDVSSEDNTQQRCLCSTLATKLNIILNGGTNNCGCCCQTNLKKNEEINCDFGTKDYLLNLKTCMDVETQSSKHVSNKINSANLLIRNKTKSVVIASASVVIQNSIEKHTAANWKSSKTNLPNLLDMKYYKLNRVNRETLLGLSDDEMQVLNSNVNLKSASNCKKAEISKHTDNRLNLANVLQLNEIKKAVLEIYKEKIISKEGEKLVAKLPKFHNETERHISHYEHKMTGHKKISKRNFVMMSINR